MLRHSAQLESGNLKLLYQSHPFAVLLTLRYNNYVLQLKKRKRKLYPFYIHSNNVDSKPICLIFVELQLSNCYTCYRLYRHSHAMIRNGKRQFKRSCQLKNWKSRRTTDKIVHKWEPAFKVPSVNFYAGTESLVNWLTVSSMIVCCVAQTSLQIVHVAYWRLIHFCRAWRQYLYRSGVQKFWVKEFQLKNFRIHIDFP